jgi:hypothetical protein
VTSGGINYATQVTVRGGSVLRPCGTVPAQNPDRPTTNRPDNPPPPPPAQQPQPTPTEVVLPPPPVAPAVVVPTARPARPAPSPPPVSPPAALPPAVILPPLSPARPLPPYGAGPLTGSSTVFQPAVKVERQKEEEEALEHQQSASHYDPGEARLMGGLVVGLILCGAFGFMAMRPRRRDRGVQLARSYVKPSTRRHWRP